MARIRTIKPEFPHSESMGRVSRDARLTFIQIWTLADDAGRLRGNSRMLASLLFPYDDDAKTLIDTWLGELERESCVLQYMVDGTTYVQICNWLSHQKIDKPSPSKLPPFDEGSRIVAKSRERSSSDLDLDQGREGKGEEPSRTVSIVIDKGTALVGGVIHALESWRRDVPEADPAAFARWIVHCELSGKMLGEAQRLGQAKLLAGNGDFPAQAEVVDFCISQGWKTLVPIRDVRARRDGMSRNGAPARRTHTPSPTTAELEAQEAARARG